MQIVITWCGKSRDYQGLGNLEEMWVGDLIATSLNSKRIFIVLIEMNLAANDRHRFWLSFGSACDLHMCWKTQAQEVQTERLRESNMHFQRL